MAIVSCIFSVINFFLRLAVRPLFSIRKMTLRLKRGKGKVLTNANPQESLPEKLMRLEETSAQLEKRFRDLEKRLTDRTSRLETMITRSASPVGIGYPARPANDKDNIYEIAMKMADKGIPGEQIIESLGLLKGEFELVCSINKMQTVNTPLPFRDRKGLL